MERRKVDMYEVILYYINSKGFQDYRIEDGGTEGMRTVAEAREFADKELQDSTSTVYGYRLVGFDQSIVEERFEEFEKDLMS